MGSYLEQTSFLIPSRRHRPGCQRVSTAFDASSASSRPLTPPFVSLPAVVHLESSGLSLQGAVVLESAGLLALWLPTGLVVRSTSVLSELRIRDWCPPSLLCYCLTVLCDTDEENLDL